MAVYEGIRTASGCRVTVDGAALPPRRDLCNHSPDGFEWGYGGSGPAQLALAILAHHCGADTGRALRSYQRFKFAVVVRLGERWRLNTEQIDAELCEIEADNEPSLKVQGG